jgi:hypothetical protein
MNKAKIEFSENKLCAFLEEGFLLFLTLIPWVDFLWVTSLVSISHWWIPMSGEPFALYLK